MIKKSIAALAFVTFLLSVPAALARDEASGPKASAKTATSPAMTKEENLKEYIKLLREDVRSQKSAVVSAVMQLDPDEAAKFWPIYRDYDAELSKLNDLRVANIEETQCRSHPYVAHRPVHQSQTSLAMCQRLIRRTRPLRQQQNLVSRKHLRRDGPMHRSRYAVTAAF